tara:strand:- start:13606 stop:14745 length:1140 start_codon:yes stop_codon:yes gene_type:complete
MASSLTSILRTKNVTKVVSRVAANSNAMLNFFGMQPGGPNTIPTGGREFSYQVFDAVRSPGILRAPGAPAARQARRPIGSVHGVFPRMHEQIDMLSEFTHNLAMVGQSDGARDEAGKAYLARQIIPTAQRAANFRTMLLVGMLRDALYVHESGDDWYGDWTTATDLVRINFQRPAGNLSKLDMLGGGDILGASWATAATDIPANLRAINSAFQELVGTGLDHVWCSSVIWGHVINNDVVQAVGGSASPPFQLYDRVAGIGPDGMPIRDQVGTITACPGVTFHITDAGLTLGAPGSESFAKLCDDTHAIFCPSPTPEIYEMREGSEPIAEYDGGPESVRMGLSSWARSRSNPTGTEVFTLDNALACDYVPKATAYGLCVY